MDQTRPRPNYQKRSSVASERPFSQQILTSRDNEVYFRPSLRYEVPTEEPRTRTVYGSNFESRFPVYGLDWTYTSDSNEARIAISSFKEDSTNHVRIIHGFPDREEDSLVTESTGNDNDSSTVVAWDFHETSGATVRYPVTKLQWDPSMRLGLSNTDRFATTSECLRVYEAGESAGSEFSSASSRLVEKLCLTNSKAKSFNQMPPLTSFDWNLADPRLIITCSIDTTCTLWDIYRGAGVTKTQLIAHDSQVFDVKFVFGDKNIFASCSNDGSVRVFDLRNLEYSTIIYEPQTQRPTVARASSSSSSSSSSPSASPALLNSNGNAKALVRLATSNYNANHIAVLEENSNRILILDLRYPGIPLVVLQQHSAPVNAIQWHPTKNILLSGSDDSQVLIWDMDNIEAQRPFSHGGQHSSVSPIFPANGFSGEMEVNNICWDPQGNWVAANIGRKMQAVKYEA
ncbi:DEKNAAC101167 [Brettanomyces naardenensis]|uniref:DEKNAAC101167 n=1 Tax=Brettanomyces naardenensis TaxID=13370 RepID=A0A448YHD4_BRENA|nr:DEKNAAC101167 [Brettanomyces naardenensis]